MELTVVILLAALCVAASVTDLRGRRIPNALNLGAALVLFAYHAALGQGALYALSGLGLGLALMLVPYAVGVMGAGDVKMLAAAGAGLGPGGVLWAFLFTSLAGGVYALIVLALHRGALRRLVSGLAVGLAHATATGDTGLIRPETDRALPKLAYGVAIACGVMAVCAARLLGVAGLPGL